MPLNSYQKHIIRDIRTDERTYGLQFLSLTTGAGYFSPLDAYRKQSYVEVATPFSGAVLTAPYANKKSSEGGFYLQSDLVIVASRDHLSIANSKNVKLEYANIKFLVNKVVDCEDTSEIVIHASRLE